MGNSKISYWNRAKLVESANAVKGVMNICLSVFGAFPTMRSTVGCIGEAFEGTRHLSFGLSLS